MQRMSQLTTRFVVLANEDIDTDQIIPARFLTSTSRDGLGKGLFADWRYDASGNPRAEFVLNQADASGAQALVAGRNFGCGSSREHAAWALAENGIRVVISTEIADIFTANALKNGLLPVVVSENVYSRMVELEAGTIEVNVEDQTLRLEGGFETTFPIDPFARHCLINGVDELAFLLQEVEAISAHERRLAANAPGVQT